MIDLTAANKLLTDREVLDRFIELFKKYIRPESYHEVIEQMGKDFMNPLFILGYVLNHDEDFIRGYVMTRLKEK